MERSENLQYEIFIQFTTGGFEGIPLATQTAVFQAALFNDALDALDGFYRKNEGIVELVHITKVKNP